MGALLVATLAMGALTARAETALSNWPPEEAKKLEALIAEHANRGEYAVFDMDNTSYQFDLTEALLPFLEAKGVLTRARLDPALKLMPFKDTETQPESLYSYYLRLCEIDDLVCYPWIAQSFAGLDLKALKPLVDEMMREQKPIPVTYFDNGKRMRSTVQPPKPYAGMQQLYRRLQENGIRVYVITAANEELVRMVAADPKYGYGVPPENVIGVNVLLQDRETGRFDTARMQIKRGKYDAARNLERMRFTSYLVNPMTWHEGKYGTIVGWIDQWRKPVLVAGDTTHSDGYMLLNGTDVARNGLRIWVDRKEKYTQQLRRWRRDAAAAQQKLGQPATADQNWIMVKPAQLHAR